MRVTTPQQTGITRSQFFRPPIGISTNQISVNADSIAVSVLPYVDRDGFTPNDHFYKHVNHSPIYVDVSDWHLTVGGLVEKPLRLSLDELHGWQRVEKPYTLAAVTSTPQNLLMGHALWRGMPLSVLLQDAAKRADALYAQFHSVNGYSTYLPIAMVEDAILAYEMNGKPMTAEHGYPVRLIVPGVYDYKMPKWVQSIELVSTPSSGLYESRGWSAEGLVQTTSAIFTPRLREHVSGKVLFSGMAFAGSRTIKRIELSIDDGDWMPVPFVAAEGGSWTRWQMDWMPPAPGDYLVKVRATDHDGFTQPDALNLPVFPNGSSANHAVVFRVSM